MNLIGDAITADEAYEYGLVNRVVPDHELFDTALAWARKLAGQAPIAVEQIKQVSAQGRPRRGHRGREGGLRGRVLQRGRQGGHRRLPRQAHAEVERQVGAEAASSGAAGARRRRAGSRLLAELIRALGASTVVALTGAGIAVPSGIPDFRTPG